MSAWPREVNRTNTENVQDNIAEAQSCALFCYVDIFHAFSDVKILLLSHQDLLIDDKVICLRMHVYVVRLLVSIDIPKFLDFRFIADLFIHTCYILTSMMKETRKLNVNRLQFLITMSLG